MPAIPSLRSLLGAGLTLASLQGCYTQLYTRDYWEKSQGFAYHRPGPDSAAADTLYPPDTARPPVIVNNYYGGVYRGHAYSDWDNPYFSLSYSSGYYRSYCEPYWWGRPGYYGHYRPHPYYPGYRPPRVGGPAGPGGGGGNYKSDKRLFPPAPAIPRPEKGERAPEPARTEETGSSGGNGNSGGGGQEKAERKREAPPPLRKGQRR